MFLDREDAGRRLARKLARFAIDERPIVLALPRGGVPVAYQVARALGAPLDVFVVRKLGVPGHGELAMGAIASGGARVINDEVVDLLGIPPEAIEAATRRERGELARREVMYRDDRPAPDVRGRTVIIVDDGLATGSTMRAAVAALRSQGPRRVIVAVPLGSEETCELLRQEADEVVCVETPEPFHAVGIWYEDFGQTTDEEVRELLERASREAAPTARRAPGQHAER